MVWMHATQQLFSAQHAVLQVITVPIVGYKFSVAFVLVLSGFQVVTFEAVRK